MADDQATDTEMEVDGNRDDYASSGNESNYFNDSITKKKASKKNSGAKRSYGNKQKPKQSDRENPKIDS